MTATGFAEWQTHELVQIEARLVRALSNPEPGELMAAMRHAVLDGGKRLRPLLVLAARHAVSQDSTDAVLDEAALRAACAIELIHAYSLVHDDMPCMDNDVLRRGKPTVHVQFGQAQALLSGDALQALAFEVLTPECGVIPDDLQGRLCRILSRAAGHGGMAGGQAIDLASVGQALDEATLRDMHHRKTGALLRASVQMGAACGGVPEDGPVWRALTAYGEAMGLAFQVVDDILDATQPSDTLGKTAGKDADANKPTYVSLLGLSAAQAEARSLRQRADDALARSGLSEAAVAPLRALAEPLTLADALARGYRATEAIHWKGAVLRRDIGLKGLRHESAGRPALNTLRDSGRCVPAPAMPPAPRSPRGCCRAQTTRGMSPSRHSVEAAASRNACRRAPQCLIGR